MRILNALFILLIASVSLFGAFEDIRSFQSSFTQTITSNENKQILYKGRIYAKEPVHGLWIYDFPMKKEIYINDTQVIIYEPELEQATLTSIRDSIDFMALLRDAKPAGTGVYETVIFEQKYKILVDNDGNIKQILFTDKLQNDVRIDFIAPEINPSLDPQLFLFMPSGDVDIIRQ